MKKLQAALLLAKHVLMHVKRAQQKTRVNRKWNIP